MKTNTTISGIFVNYASYIWSEGREPKGKGNWIFYFGDEDEPRFYYGTFAAARKQAVMDAKASGFCKIRL